MYSSLSVIPAILSLILMASCGAGDNLPAAGAAEADGIRLTVVFNNELHPGSGLETSWGFACMVEGLGPGLLFDTGGDGRILLDNMRRMDLSAADVEHVVLSHYHGDHVDGLPALLEARPEMTVWFPESFPDSFAQKVSAAGATVRPVGEPRKLFGAAHSTGNVEGPVNEQALVLESAKGPVLITGCSHPGIDILAGRVAEVHGSGPYMVLGGFHLGEASPEKVEAIIDRLRELGVRKLGATHCTGDMAMEMFRREWGDDYIDCGAGAVIEL